MPRPATTAAAATPRPSAPRPAEPRPATPRPSAPRPAAPRSAAPRPAATTAAVTACIFLTLGACHTAPSTPTTAAPSPATLTASSPAFPSTPSPTSTATALPAPEPGSASDPHHSPTNPEISPNSTAKRSPGWEITVYYTAVERFHSGDTTTVTGCPSIDCTDGDADLGTYPADFVAAVEEEGTGRTTAGRYLNWSYDVGFWLDSAPRDTAGRALRPFVSAAADPDVLTQGTRFTIAACGSADDGSRPDAEVCARLRRASWTVTDEFTPGRGGSKHIDAYIGEETARNFRNSPWYLTLAGATLQLA